jgi:hypothetical protein
MMRLLNTTTFKLEEFSPDNLPGYGILSHRWRDEEMTIEDMEKGGYQWIRRWMKQGWKKIHGYCKHPGAKFQYVWVDTCCIDKRSSAELQEAVNSMFRWYRDSEMCHIYLDDVDDLKDFEASEWFKRGWTLQELLAPRTATFYNKNWEVLGTRSALAMRIENFTGIGIPYLTGSDSFVSASIATRMGWASGRKTTRTEDRAYSLLGIFDINMPIIYGEGERSFFRLQAEILKVSDDHSLFIWDGGVDCNPQKMLARTPDSFRRKDIDKESTLFSEMWGRVPTAPANQDFVLTNLGVRAYLPISRLMDFDVTSIGKCPFTHKCTFKIEGRELEVTVTVGRNELKESKCSTCKENVPLFFIALANCSAQEGTSSFLMRKIMGTSNRYERVHVSGYCFATTAPRYYEFMVLYVR